MTYEQAQIFIKNYWDKLCPSLVHSKPAHMREKQIIAPENSKLNTLTTILFLMEDEHLPNNIILERMELMNDNLIVYVVFKTQGYTSILPFHVYETIEWSMEGGTFGN